MATALEIIERAFSIMGEKAEETTLESSEAQDALDTLNDLGLEWEMSGANLGFAAVANLADELRIPRPAESAFKYGLAVRLAPEYGISLSPEHVAIANETKRALMRNFKRPLQVAMPDTLPTGSGNDCESDFYTDRFFSQNKNENF